MTMVQSSGDPHYPVMVPEVLEALDVRDGGVYVDGTFGAGGYSRGILGAAECTVYAVDRDVSAVSTAEGVAKDYGARFVFLRGCFGDVRALLDEAGVKRVNGFVLDIGVSSMQLDEAERGFSFRYDGPLDMRMDTRSEGETAADIVNNYAQDDLANLIYQFGEERHSRRVARKIVERRQETPFTRTLDLADVVRSAVPKSKNSKLDGATRTFQALRIAVNDELGELDRALEAAEDILAVGGRLVIVSFHSLEDKRVKRFMRERSKTHEGGSRHLPQVSAPEDAAPTFKLISRKAIKPSEKEVAENPRSRSARLRVAERTSSQMEAV